MRTTDVAGQTFGLLTAREYVGRSRWLCLCQCGGVVRVRLNNLRSGNSRSCGCADKAPRDTTPETRLRTVRIARGRTQADLALRLGVSAMTISRWERDRARPSKEQWLALADALDVYPSLIDSPEVTVDQLRGAGTK